MIRTRIAPSPTGFAHVGTAYTALFNFAYAKHSDGTFIIRIEDSDLKRNIKGADKKIYEALAWLGIDWDEGETKGGDFGPYTLSKRLSIYKEKADKLVAEGKAYKDDGAIRFKNPGTDVSWKDLVRGDITFPGGEVADFVMIKADGYPTYNFNVVVDDIAMKVTHIIRGEDHISNTPRQIALYQAFGATPPEFAHHPLLVNSERKKLSKRDAAVDIMHYKSEGYLPEAFVNFLCLMGWSHPDAKEIFSLSEFVSQFTIDRVRQSGSNFDLKKLEWINGEYIRLMDDSKLKSHIMNFFDDKYREAELAKIVPLIKTRIKTLKEFQDIAGFFFKAPKVNKSHFGGGAKNHLKGAIEVLTNIEDWKKENIDRALLGLIDKMSFKTGDFFMDFRIAITGVRSTPPINDSIIILGQKETLSRLQNALE